MLWYTVLQCMGDGRQRKTIYQEDSLCLKIDTDYVSSYVGTSMGMGIYNIGDAHTHD